MQGAFQTTRDIFDNTIWRNIVEFRLFFLIYGKAAFVDGVKIGNKELKRGQWIRSYRNLQDDLEYVENRSVKKYSLSTIHKAVDNLIKKDRIKIEECELGTLFEVLNYAKYQGLENYKNCIENEERTESERRANGTRTEREQNANNNNKYNNTNNIDDDDNACVREVFNFYQNNVGLLTAFQIESINSYLDDGLTPDLIVEAMKNSLGADNVWQYLNAALNNCVSQNIKTLEQYNAKKVERKNKYNKKGVEQDGGNENNTGTSGFKGIDKSKFLANTGEDI